MKLFKKCALLSLLTVGVALNASPQRQEIGNVQAALLGAGSTLVTTMGLNELNQGNPCTLMSIMSGVANGLVVNDSPEIRIFSSAVMGAIMMSSYLFNAGRGKSFMHYLATSVVPYTFAYTVGTVIEGQLN